MASLASKPLAALRRRRGPTSAWATVRRTAIHFHLNGLADQAALLTYYGLLSLFPGVIVLVSVLGLFGDPHTTTDALVGIVSDVAPGAAASTFQGPIEEIVSASHTASVMFFVGLAAALWSASWYASAFVRTNNVIYERDEGRSFWQLRGLQLMLTVALVLLFVVALLAIVFTGPVVDAAAEPLGLSDAAVAAWDVAKWPVLVLVALTAVGILYWVGPNARHARLIAIVPGAVLALVLWVGVSAAFAYYLSRFGSYQRTYGALGGVISLLIWLWLTNVALLLGAQFNAELERTRELAHGDAEAEEHILLPPRAAR